MMENYGEQKRKQILKGFGINEDLEKAKSLPIGTKRTYDGLDYVKVSQGKGQWKNWQLVSKKKPELKKEKTEESIKEKIQQYESELKNQRRMLLVSMKFGGGRAETNQKILRNIDILESNIKILKERVEKKPTLKEEKLTSTTLINKLNKVLSSKLEVGYHGHKTGSEVLGWEGAEPDEFHFRIKYGTRDFREKDKETIKQVLGNISHRIEGSNLYVKGYKE